MRFVAVCAALFAVSACTSNSSTPASSTASSPQASRPDPSPASQPAKPSSAPHAMPPAGDPLSGTIALADDVKSDVKASDTLYIMARTHQGGGLAGRLVAVKRMSGLEPDGFPARFELSSADTMVAGVPFKGPFVIYARLDRDGDPMTKTEADLYAALSEPAANGAKDLKLVLKKGMPKTLSAPRGPAPTPSSAPASAPAGH